MSKTLQFVLVTGKLTNAYTKKRHIAKNEATYPETLAVFAFL